MPGVFFVLLCVEFYSDQKLCLDVRYAKIMSTTDEEKEEMIQRVLDTLDEGFKMIYSSYTSTGSALAL